MTIKAEEILTTTGKVRSAVADALLRLSKGQLPANDAKAILGLCNAISTSIAVEIKYQTTQSSLGNKVDTFGKLNIGE